MTALSLFVLALMIFADLSRRIDDHREARKENKSYNEYVIAKYHLDESYSFEERKES